MVHEVVQPSGSMEVFEPPPKKRKVSVLTLAVVVCQFLLDQILTRIQKPANDSFADAGLPLKLVSG